MVHGILISVFCIASSVFFTSCESLQLPSSAHNDIGTHAAFDHDYQLIYPRVQLPRKLKLREDQLQASVKKVFNRGDQDLSRSSTKKDAFSAGKARNVEITERKHAPIRRWREWVETEKSDTSQYFTMDYSHVRRRRPIHNKSLPVAP